MKQRDILFLLISSCIVVFVWIAFTIIHNSQTSTVSEGTAQDISPIQATFDTKVIEKMKARLVVSPALTIQVTPGQDVIIQQVSITPAPLATAPATLATQGGTTK